jgi:hypothetical protein
MQAGMSGRQTGFCGVGAGFGWANQHGALRPSTQAEPGDLIGFQWDGQGLAGDWERMHVEMCISLSGSTLTTIGGNSGPSPDGRDGVNAHTWLAGGSLIIGAIDTALLVHFTGPPPAGPHPVKPAPTPVPQPAGQDPNPWWPHRLVQVHGHAQVWQMRLIGGRHLAKAQVPDPVRYQQALARGQTRQELLNTQHNLDQLAAIQTIAW